MKRTRGFRLGVYIFKDAEIIDYAAPYGVFSVARRLDPELDAFLVADAMKPVQTQAGLTVHPNYSFNDQPDIYGRMGLLDGLSATSRKEPDRLEASEMGQVPIDRLADIAPACRVSRARIVDSGRIITAGGIASGMEMGFHLLRRAGYDESFIEETARVMEYQEGYSQYQDDIEYVRKEK